MAAPPAPHSLILPGDFIFIYKQDKNPSSINLGEQKMEKKEGGQKELVSIQERRK